MKPQSLPSTDKAREEQEGAQPEDSLQLVRPVPPPPEPVEEPPDIPATGIEGACSDFDFNLLEQVIAADPSSNVVLSPFSVRMALAMAYNGADGGARDAMAEVLDFEGMSLERVNALMHDLLLSLGQPGEKIQLEIANSFWGQSELNFYEELLQACRDCYGAELQRVDFTDPETVQIINAWANEMTHGKIPQIVPDHQAIRDNRFAWMNAIYFKAAWALQFEEDQTREDDFILPDGQRKRIPLMRQSARLEYLENEDFQAVRLPYEEGRLGMYIFLPREGKDLAGLYPELNRGNWERWMQEFEPRQGTIFLPRFEVGYGNDLTNTLKAMRMGPAFEGYALPKVYETLDPVSIMIVLHKAVIEVNEEGTEGAAVTYVGGGPTCVRPDPTEPFTMKVNRPFFFAIRDNQTGALLFMGSIVDPS